MCYWRVGSSCSTCDTWHVTLVTGPVISHKWGFVSFIVMKRTNFPLNHYIENKIPLIFNYYLQCYNKLTLRNKVDFYFFFSPMFYTFKKLHFLTSLFSSWFNKNIMTHSRSMYNEYLFITRNVHFHFEE